MVFKIDIKKKAGFTIIELVITMLVIAILSAVLFASTRQSEEKSLLNKTAFQMAQDLREVQQMAMSAESYDCGGGNTTRIFGLFIKRPGGDWQEEYTLFADCDKDDEYDSGGGSPDPIIKFVQFESEIKVCNVINPPPPIELSIVFRPPNPNTIIDHSVVGVDKEDVEFELCLFSDNSIKRYIRINTAGRIEIE